MAARVVRLTWGVVRRNRAGLLSLLWIGPMLMRTLAKETVSPVWLMAASMGVSFMLGLSGEQVRCREHRVLPVTDRDLWVARWLYSALVAPGWMFILKCLGLALAAASGTTLMTVETLALSTLFDVVYSGALVAAPLLMPLVTRAMVRPLDKIPLPVGSPQRKAVGLLTVTVLAIVIPGFFLLGLGGPLFFARQLPTHLADFSSTSTIVLLTGVVMALAGLLSTPKQGGDRVLYREVPKAASPQPEVAEAALPRPIEQRGFAGRFVGIASVAWSHVVTTLVATAIGYAIAIAACRFFPEPAGSDPRFVDMMFLIFAMMGVTMWSVWSSRVRLLRILPMPIEVVNSLFVLTPLVTWLAMWLILLIAHAVMGWSIHEELGPHAVLMYAGFTSVTHALEQRFSGSAAGRSITGMVGIAGAGGIAFSFFGHHDLTARLSVIAIGLLCFVLAAVINHYTFTRSTSSARAYRRLGVA
jgi:hypothetical protein